MVTATPPVEDTDIDLEALFRESSPPQCEAIDHATQERCLNDATTELAFECDCSDRPRSCWLCTPHFLRITDALHVYQCVFCKMPIKNWRVIN